MPTTDALPPHVRRMVDEIETEIGEEPGRASSTIEGEGRDHDANGRVEDAVRQILLEIGEDPDRQGLAGTPGTRPSDVHGADGRLPRRSRSG